MISRREWLSGTFATAHAWAVPRRMKQMADALAGPPEPRQVVIESHIHLFAGDPRFPYNSASYPPKPEPVEEYVKFAQEAHIDHAVIVHPEPYQNDHRY